MRPVIQNNAPDTNQDQYRRIRMPKGRSTFTKRQKEHTRQQRQRDKAERKKERKQAKSLDGSVDETDQLREHAAEQAALFNLGADEVNAADESETTSTGG
jgi:hypothetical protein